MTPTAADRLEQLQRRLLIAGGAAAALCALGGLLNVGQFFRSYLLGFLLWHGMAVGCLTLLLLQYILPSHWGRETRSLMQAGANTLPFTALLFVPLALGVGVGKAMGVDKLYIWVEPPRGDALLAGKAAYLNVPFFLARAGGYFAVWSALAWWAGAWLPEPNEPHAPKALRRLSAAGLVLIAVTVTFAAVDWLMSLEPHWYSSMFPLAVAAGAVVSALALVILTAYTLGRLGAREPPSADTSADLGAVFLALVMLWAYLGVSQFLLIWSANLPEEAGWFVHRLEHGWQWVAAAIALFHFAVPFLMLLSRDLRSNLRLLAGIAGLLLVMRFVDLLWMIAPTFHPRGLFVHWLDLAAPAAVGGLWLAAFVRQLRRQHGPRVSSQTVYAPSTEELSHE